MLGRRRRTAAQPGMLLVSWLFSDLLVLSRIFAVPSTVTAAVFICLSTLL